MPYVRCPRCGATHYSVGRHSAHERCPRCFELLHSDGQETPSLRRRLPPEPDAAARARRSLVEAFTDELEEDAVARAMLIATELVTNSIKHARNGDHPIELFATADDERLRIEVTDGGEGFDPGRREALAAQGSGWGLMIVDELADRWGVERGRSFRVWAELALATPTAAA